MLITYIYTRVTVMWLWAAYLTESCIGKTFRGLSGQSLRDSYAEYTTPTQSICAMQCGSAENCITFEYDHIRNFCRVSSSPAQRSDNRTNKSSLFMVNFPTPPECITAINLTEAWRQDHVGSQILPISGALNCDIRNMILNRPWFRFTGDAGNMLLDHCPLAHSCGTHAGIWSNNSMPTVVGVSKDIVAYLSWTTCEFRPKPISVILCSVTRPHDYIYKYLGDEHCSIGFCGMNGAVWQKSESTKDSTGAQASGRPEECISATNLTEAWRQDHVGSRIKPINGKENCDSSSMLSERPWFRFTGAAGNMLLDHCPSSYSCGTHAGIWSNNSMPTAVGIAADVVAYLGWTSCDFRPKPLSVMRCSNANSYDLIYKYLGDEHCYIGFCGMSVEP